MLPALFNPDLAILSRPFAGRRIFGGDIDSFFDRCLGSVASHVPTPYPTDVWEGKDNLYVAIDVPGMTKDQMNISVENGVLTIAAERKEETPQDADHYHLRERRISRFERRFRLPDSVDQDSISAVLKDGVLTVTLKRREELKPKTITVEDGNA